MIHNVLPEEGLPAHVEVCHLTEHLLVLHLVVTDDLLALLHRQAVALVVVLMLVVVMKYEVDLDNV